MNTPLLKSIVINFNYFIIYYVLVINFIYFIQLILAAFNLSDYVKKIRYSDYKKYITSDNMIPISILVPAYNEQETIVENIKSLISLKYPKFEVIVINDGSKDETLNRVIQEFDLKEVNQPVRYRINTNKIRGIYKNLDIPNLIVVDKENGGKADALNAGINISIYSLPRLRLAISKEHIVSIRLALDNDFPKSQTFANQLLTPFVKQLYP